MGSTTALLINEMTLKAYVPIDENLYGAYVCPAILTAQERYIQEVCGKCLYRALQEKVYENTVDAPYDELLNDYIAPYLAWTAGAEAISMTYIKVANLAVARMTDTGVNFITPEEMNSLRDEYINRAGIYKNKLVNYLLENQKSFPELKSCTCDDGPQYAIDECSIFLGGARNPDKKYRR